MKKYKAIILVIASPSGYYNKNKQVMKKFMNSNPDILTLFIYGIVNKKFVTPSKYDLFFNCPESIRPGILMKSMMAFGHILERYDFDYVVRTNISTFWHFNNLLNVLDKLPNKNCIAGKINKKNFISGTSIILSKDLIEYIVKNTNKIRINISDDVELSHFYKSELKLPLIRVPRCDKYVNKFPLNTQSIPKNYICYRVKTNNNRYMDSIKMLKLFKVFYK